MNAIRMVDAIHSLLAEVTQEIYSRKQTGAIVPFNAVEQTKIWEAFYLIESVFASDEAFHRKKER